MTADQVRSFLDMVQNDMGFDLGYHVFVPYPIPESFEGSMNQKGFLAAAKSLAASLQEKGYSCLVYEGSEQLPCGVLVGKMPHAPMVRVFTKLKPQPIPQNDID